MANIRVNRRDFLRGMGATLACQTAMPAKANPLHMPIGFQGYDARFLLIQDWDQGWREIRDMGYQAVDLVSFKGYGYENSPLAKLSAEEIRQRPSAGVEGDAPSPHHRAALYALSQLTWSYLGSKASDWQDEVSRRVGKDQGR